MGTSLNTKATDAPTRLPGDFARHPFTGAPYVSSITGTRQRKGKKADLLAIAEREGIDVPPKVTIPQLHALLGPEPAMEMYGRPSGFGKQIENTTNLQKWAERAVALGVYVDPFVLSPITDLAPEQRNLDDKTAKPILDSIAVAAKRAAQAGIAADRGTHTHALTEDFDNERDWIERARTGEDLGLPAEVQQAMVDEWEEMLAHTGMEILAVEAPVVDDAWRQAGTLDRVARIGAPLTFAYGDGFVTIPMDTVIILDVKTGKLRVGSDGHPDHWHGYAVQLASYAQAKPYDTDTDTRGEWPWPIDQQWAIIAHLDVLSALAGKPVCRLVLVDLEAGRHAGALCVAARTWEKRRDVFSTIIDVDSPIDATGTGAPPRTQAAPIGVAANGAAVPDIAATAPAPVAAEPDTAGVPPAPAVSDDFPTYAPKGSPCDTTSAQPTTQPVESSSSPESSSATTSPAPESTSTASPSQDCCDTDSKSDGTTSPNSDDSSTLMEQPLTEPVPEEVKAAADREYRERMIRAASVPADRDAADLLVTNCKRSKHRDLVARWVQEGGRAGVAWSVRASRTVLNFERLRTALELAEALEGDEQLVRLMLHASSRHRLGEHTIGEHFGRMTVEDCIEALACLARIGDDVSIGYEDGEPVLYFAGAYPGAA